MIREKRLTPSPAPRARKTHAGQEALARHALGDPAGSACRVAQGYRPPAQPLHVLGGAAHRQPVARMADRQHVVLGLALIARAAAQVDGVAGDHFVAEFAGLGSVTLDFT